jgi:hypothetical protein
VGHQNCPYLSSTHHRSQEEKCDKPLAVTEFPYSFPKARQSISEIKMISSSSFQRRKQNGLSLKRCDFILCSAASLQCALLLWPCIAIIVINSRNEHTTLVLILIFDIYIMFPSISAHNLRTSDLYC